MATFTLTVRFERADLTTIRSTGEWVVLVRGLKTTDPGDVAWCAFRPFECITVTWEDGGYGTFASQTVVQAGNVIRRIATGGAAERESVVLTDQGSFSSPAPDPNVESGQYGVVNGSSGNPLLTFGLQQALTMNGVSQPASPLVASAVPRGQFTVFEPLEALSVFLDSSIRTGWIVQVPTAPSTGTPPGRVTSFATEVQLSPGSPGATLLYDAGRGRFEQVADDPC